MQKLIKRFFILLIKIYQYAVSPFLGQNCRFYPSCSSYTIQAIELHGIFKGSWLALRRIIRCNPLCDGGIDPVPGTEHLYTDDEKPTSSCSHHTK